MGLTIIITILILGVIIFVHELGHYVAAKFFKMPIAEFSIGMGPKLFGWKKGETEYNLRGIPLGGYVNILGMEPDDKTPDGFYTKKPYQRFIVLFAGVFMNFILAWMISVAMFLSVGEYIPSNEPVIGNIEAPMPAFGILKKGDIINKIDGIEIKKWEDVYKTLSVKKVPEVSLEVTRGKEFFKADIKMKYEEKAKRYILGIAPQTIHKTYGFIEAVEKGTKQFLNIFKSVFMTFEMLAKNQVTSKDISGPIGMVKVVSVFADMGIPYLFFLTALISVSVGVFNLLPFPALDGGRIIFVILEMFGIKISKKIEEGFHRAGLILLLMLMVWTIFNDIVNWPNKIEF